MGRCVSIEIYNEMTVSLAWERLEPLLEFLDGALSGQGCPTAGRLRLRVAVEELFSCAMAGAAGEDGSLTCRTEPPWQMSFRFARGGTPFFPETPDLEALLIQPCSAGVSLRREGETFILRLEEAT